MMKRALFAIAIALSFTASAREARLLRFPAVGGDNIVFTYAGNLYRVPVMGGEAVKLTSDVGYEMFARISPDGKTIAFTGQYDGNTEVYTMPVTGGEPRRLTYTALVERDMVGERMGPNNIVMCWTPDGKDIVYRSKWYNFSGLRAQLHKISYKGGLPEQIPSTEGGFCSFSPNGRQMAFNRMFREFRTWKYYRGGQADEIWINKVGSSSLEKITDNDAQDIFPMWIGDEIFYLSDRDRTMNLFVYDTKSKKTEKLTSFTEYDCKFPSYSKEWIVFENGGYIYRFNVAKRSCEKVSITLADDNIYGRSTYISLSGKAMSFSLSPGGDRVLMISRGDVFSLPATEGAVYNVTRTPGAHEREAIWSPDGKSIAYLSDRDGEYQVYIAPATDMENARRMTSFKNGYPTGLQWSPDSKKLYFGTEKRDCFCLDVESGRCERIIASQTSSPRGLRISPDGRWAAYSVALENRYSAVFLFDLEKRKSYQVTDRWYDASGPIFSQDGKYLFFTSSTELHPQYSHVEWNTSFTTSDRIFVLPLAKDTPDPTAIDAKEYSPEKESSASKGNSAKDSTTKVDIDGIGERISPLSLPSGRYFLNCAFEGKLYYSKGGKFYSYDLKSRKEKEAGETPRSTTPDFKKALVWGDGHKMCVIPFGGSAKGVEPVPTDNMDMMLDRKAEWKACFDESWRVFRDNFYVENMHGLNWKAIHDKYAVMLPFVNHDHDLTYLIGEMISEASIGHAYITTGFCPEVPHVETGLLGGKFSKDKSTGAFRIDHVFKGENWDKSLRSPLDEAGVKAKEGEYIVKVNGIPSSNLDNIYRALIGKVGKTISLVIAKDASGKDSRTVYLKPTADESHLAYIEWVRGNIEKVDRLSGGEIGYIHIPDMGAEGLTMFTKLFYTQLDKKALIIDDRMNGGGNVSPMILERLQRKVYRMSMYRNGSNLPVPNEAFYGPMVCLIDKYSSSDGDLFPYGFRQLGLGKLIGKRSWGGIVGISSSRQYLNGQDMRTPFFTSYDLEGNWIIEGHGVDPDIEVDINPFEDFKGKDAQLEKAVEVLKEEMKAYKPLPGTPKAPDKSKIGLK